MAENEGAAAGPIMPGPDGTAEQWAIYFRDSAQGLQAQNAQLFAQLQQQQQLNAELRAYIQALPQGGGAPPVGPNGGGALGQAPVNPPARYNVALQTFSGTGWSEYRRWECSIQHCITANGWTFPRAAAAVLASCRDNAADIVRGIAEENFPDWPTLQAALRRLFMSPSFRNQARSQFEGHVQQKGENLPTYHGILQSLYNSAYEPQERVPRVLIDKFIAGIRDSKLHELFHTRITIVGRPATYDNALEVGMNIAAELEITGIERGKWASGKGGTSASPMAMPNYSQNGVDSTPTSGEAMDVNTLNYCTHHRVETHDTANCRALTTTSLTPRKSNGGNGANGASGEKKMEKQRAPKVPGPNDICGLCRGKGHWRRQCPSDPKIAKVSNPKAGGRNVNSVEDTEKDEELKENEGSEEEYPNDGWDEEEED